MSTSLCELGGYLTVRDYGDGARLSTLVFDCPTCPSTRPHAQVIPYSDEPCHRIPWPAGGEGREILVWQRTAGSSLDDLTLAPSFLVPSCGLHGHVVAGRWVPC